MNRQMREVIQLAQEIHESATVEHTRSGHFRVRFCGPKGSRVAFVCGTPSDHRSRLNDRKNMRHVAREVGIEAV